MATGVLIVAAFASSGYAAKQEDFNVDFTPGWGGCYRPMEWTPIVVGVSSRLTEPFGGMVTITAQQEEMSRMVVAHHFVLTPQLPLHLPLVAKFAFAVGDCNVRIVDTAKGKTCWNGKYNLTDFSESAKMLTPIGREDMLIATVGRGGRELTQLQRKAASRTEHRLGEVHVKPVLTRYLPWDWTGFASLDLLILYDPDWDLINAHQSKAIAQWVDNGGHLLVIFAAHPLPEEHPIAKLLPFELGEPIQRSIPEDVLGSWGCDRERDTTITCRRLRAKPSTHCWQSIANEYRLNEPARRSGHYGHMSSTVTQTEGVRYDSADPLFAFASVGFGRVGVIGFDPGDVKELKQDKAVKFWVHHLGAIIHTGSDRSQQRTLVLTEGTQDDQYGYHSFEAGPKDRSLNTLFGHLLAIAELRPLSIWWVILMLSSLAILLGPVDYLLLKRLDRQPLTWLTAAGWIVLFTAFAYYGVQMLRSGQVQVRAVSVVDAIQGKRQAWETTYMSLFAPDSDEYKLENLAGCQWWSAISPVQEQMYGFNRSGIDREIACLQHDGGNLPVSLPINIWSAQCMMSESPVEQIPISAKVTKLPGGEAIAVITNLSDCPIQRGCVRFADEMALRFGEVPVKGTGEFRGRLSKDKKWTCPGGDEYWSYPGADRGADSDRLNTSAAYFSRGCLDRTLGIRQCLCDGAAVVCAEYAGAPLPFVVADRNCKEVHTRLVRLVVHPQEGTDK